MTLEALSVYQRLQNTYIETEWRAVFESFFLSLPKSILAGSSEGLDCSNVAGIPEAMMPSMVKDLMGSNGWDANDDGKVTREDAETIGGQYPALFEEIKDLYSKDDELITYEDMAMYIGCEKKEYVPLAI